MNVAFPRNLGLKNSTPEGEKIYIYTSSLQSLLFTGGDSLQEHRQNPRGPVLFSDFAGTPKLNKLPKNAMLLARQVEAARHPAGFAVPAHVGERHR